MVKVLIIGIGDPVPPFIYRRLLALLRNGVKLSVVADYGQQLNLPGAEVITIDRKRNLRALLVSVRNLVERPALFLRMLRARKQLNFVQRLKWAFKYLPLLRVSPPDIIHVQWLSSVPELDWLTDFFSCPVVASARGSQVTVYPLTRPGYRNRVEQAIRMVDYVHCVSWDIAKACENLGATKERTFVNYNGINLNEFKPQYVLDEHSIFTLISVGALIWRKGYIYQLLLLKKLISKGYNVRLVCIGGGPDLEPLEYYTAQYGLQGYVQFVGKVDSNELLSWYHQADICISTSVAEGLANSVMEAAACGLPVVGFACEGMNEIVRRDESGFIVPFGDTDALAERVIYLIDNPEKRKAMANVARMHIVAGFDEEHCVLQMIEKYKSMILS